MLAYLLGLLVKLLLGMLALVMCVTAMGFVKEMWDSSSGDGASAESAEGAKIEYEELTSAERANDDEEGASPHQAEASALTEGRLRAGGCQGSSLALRDGFGWGRSPSQFSSFRRSSSTSVCKISGRLGVQRAESCGE